jgi:hypothetical protein
MVRHFRVRLPRDDTHLRNLTQIPMVHQCRCSIGVLPLGVKRPNSDMVSPGIHDLQWRPNYHILHSEGQIIEWNQGDAATIIYT